MEAWRGRAGLAGALTLLAGSAAAQPPSCTSTIDRVPTTITAPGTYCLARDLAYAGGEAAIVIAAGGVTLDLNGFTLAGRAGSGSMSIGVASTGVDGVTVRNGTIAGFRQGARLEGGVAHLVEGVRAEGNWFYGLFVIGDSSTVQNCEVVSTGGSTVPDDMIPVGIGGARNDVVIANNLVQDTLPPPAGEAVGIALYPGSRMRAERNVIVNATLAANTWGVWNHATAVQIRDNLIIRYDFGMGLAPPSSGVYASNTFFNLVTPVVHGTLDMMDGGNAVVRAFCEPIYSLPYVVSQQGSYCLVRNLSTAIASGRAISIEADSVRLDLRGFKVGGGAAGPGSQAVGIHAVDRRNVTVANGNVRGFGTAVFLEDTSPGQSAAAGYRVERILADGNAAAGIHVQGRSALVRGNHVVETGTGGAGDSYGIRVEGSLARVLDNQVSGTASTSGTAFSVSLSGGRGSIVDGNRISGAAGGSSVGVFLSSAMDTLATRNRIVGTGTGILFSGSSGRYRDNVTAGVGTPYVGGTDAGHNN